MFHATHSTRRSFLRRTALALAGAGPLGSWLMQDARASKNDHRRPSAVKANKFIDQCFEAGGEPEVGNVTDTTVDVSCTSADGSWSTCTFTNTSKSSKCKGSGDSQPLVSPLWNLSPITVVSDPSGLTNGEADEIAFTLTFVSPSGRKRHKRRKRHGRKK